MRLRLSPAPPELLYQQPRNHRRLEQHGEDDAYDLPAVVLPRRRLTKADIAAGRQAAFADAPALQLPPVEFRCREIP